jgi:mono/diheme cytochrome c family protein
MQIADCRLQIARRPFHLAFRAFCILQFGFSILLAGCSGCGSNPEAYPDTFTYPAREEWIVVELPKDPPTKPEPPGELEESIRRINDHGGKVLDPAVVPGPLRDELNRFLQQTFGTPAKPTIQGNEESKALAASLGLTDDNLAAGSRLFRKHCQECHGPTGNGRGPTAAWITPHPRDFRQGVFKFVSTNGTTSRKPTRDDLFHTLSNGLPSTQMPSFALRSEDERHRLIDYVIYLSVRGKTEFEILRTLLVHGEDGLNESVSADAEAVIHSELRAWTKAQTDVMPARFPPFREGQLEDSIRRGQALFIDPKGGGCATCHLNYGREAKYQYDVWGTVLKPGDLTETRRKGGTAPEQLYHRIRGGIGPSNMPAPTGLSDQQFWDLVNFVKAMPYPDRLPEDVKAKVYAK